MSDHQFNWSSVYSLLDHISDLTKTMNKMADKPEHPEHNNNEASSNDVSTRQQGHAKELTNRLTDNAVQSLQSLSHINAKYRSELTTKIRHLNGYNQKLLNRDLDNEAVHNLVSGTKIQLKKIVAGAKIKNYIQLNVDEVQHAKLNQTQKDAASKEVKTTAQYAFNELIKCHDVSQIDRIVTSCLNAINGAAVKYIIDCKINDINEVNLLSRTLKKQVDKRSDVDSTVKSLAHQALESIRTQAVVDLMGQENNHFQRLNKITQSNETQLRHVLDSVDNLKAFKAFVSNVKDVIVAIKLSVNGKYQLNQKINQQADLVINNLNGAYRYFDQKQLTHQEARLAITAIKAVAKQYEDQIMQQALDLESGQRTKVASQIRRVAHALCQDLVRDHGNQPFKVDLKSALDQLQTIMNQRHSLAYSNQVKQIVHDAQMQIEQYSDFTNSDKHYLWILADNYGKAVQNRKDHMRLSQVRSSLQELFNEQVDFIEKDSLKYHFDDLTRQIKLSHLSKEQRQALDKQISGIRDNPKLDYSNKMLFLKTISNYALVLDQSQNLHLLSQLSKDINKKVNPQDVLVLKQRLEHNLYAFNQKIDDVSGILALDHREQKYENRAYQMWFDLVIHDNDLKEAQMAKVTKIKDAAHRYIKLAILKQWFNHLVLDRIDRQVNQSVLLIGSIYDVDKIKAEPKALKKRVQAEYDQALVDAKQVYANEVDRLVQDVQSRLVAYPEFKNVVGKIGLIRSRTMTRIKNFADLLNVEHVKQTNESNLYKIVSRVVDAGNPAKALAHKKIRQMVERVQKELSKHQSDSEEINVAFANRILLVQNQADSCINEDLNEEVSHEYAHARKSLDMILRRHYLHRWSAMVDQSKAVINNLSSIADDVRDKALDTIMSIKGAVAVELGKCDINNLYTIIHTNQGRIDEIAKEVVARDPVKKQVFAQLKRLTKQVHDYIETHARGRVRSFMIKRLRYMNFAVKTLLSKTPDPKVKAVYKEHAKKIQDLQISIVRHVQMNKFGKVTNLISQQIRSLHLLAGPEKHHFNVQFNRCYHKSVYDIKHSPDIEYCVKNEQHGEAEVNRLFAEVQKRNQHKQKIFDDIKAVVRSNRHIVQELQYIKPGDKTNSDRLLLRAQSQALKKIKQAVQTKKLDMIQKSSRSVIQQIVNEVTSANVLLAAIKSADDLVRNSKLGPAQKKATLHQINLIFELGIKAQQQQAPQDNDNEIKTDKFDSSARPKTEHKSKVVKNERKKSEVKAPKPKHISKPKKAIAEPTVSDDQSRHVGGVIKNFFKKLGQAF